DPVPAAHEPLVSLSADVRIEGGRAAAEPSTRAPAGAGRVRRLVLDMKDRRPVWAMPEWVPLELAAALPAEWALTVIDDATDGSGDGAARVSPRVLEAVRDAEIYLGYGVPAELLESGSHLAWVHSG